MLAPTATPPPRTANVDLGFAAIAYNHLNLPYRFDFADGRRIELLYTATGQKLRELTYAASDLTTAERRRDYLAGRERGNDSLRLIHQPEGRLVPDAGTDGHDFSAYSYEYNLTDHLGNVRVRFAEDGSYLDEYHYYPFGLEQRGSWGEADVGQRYRYNGMERNEELGLDLAFYRSYDPAIGRWMQIDPKAESFATMSPYTGMGNNPISIIDPMGDSLYVSFQNDQARSVFVQLVNSGLEGQFSVDIREDGKVSLVGVDDAGDVEQLSAHGKGFYDELQTVINGKGATNVEAVYNSSAVHTGSFYKSQFDMADILQFSGDVTRLGGTAMGKLIHELHEQFSVQDGLGRVIGNPVFENHHGPASRAEDNVNKSTRTDDENLANTQHFTSLDGKRTVTQYINTSVPRSWRNLFLGGTRGTIKVEDK